MYEFQNYLAQDGEARDGASREPISVLHVINGEHYAGAERVQDLLGETLPRYGFRPVFAALKPDQFPAKRRFTEPPLYATPMRSRFDLRPARALAAIALREDCRVIHTHTVRAALVGRVAAALTGLPMVHHLHSPTTSETTRSMRNLFNAAMERVSTCNIAGAIAVSSSLRGYGEEHGIPAERISVVHNGVLICSTFAPRATPTGTWTIGCMALYRPRKGLETLLDAIPLLRDVGLKVRLRAVGKFETPEYEREILERVARLGIADAIEWRGFRSNTAAEFAAMDLFVLPSLFGEGLPMVMLEAMSFGVPIVASRVEGVPEAIVDERDGLIVRPGDATALSEAIARYLLGAVDWQGFRISARRRQAAEFSTESMARGTADVYRRVLGEAAGEPFPADQETTNVESVGRQEVAELAAV